MGDGWVENTNCRVDEWEEKVRNGELYFNIQNPESELAPHTGDMILRSSLKVQVHRSTKHVDLSYTLQYLIAPSLQRSLATL